jgi:hypothetical protein
VRGHAARSAGSDDDRVIGFGQVYLGLCHEKTLLALSRLDSVALLCGFAKVDYAKGQADKGCKVSPGAMAFNNGPASLSSVNVAW